MLAVSVYGVLYGVVHADPSKKSDILVLPSNVLTGASNSQSFSTGASNVEPLCSLVNILVML